MTRNHRIRIEALLGIIFLVVGLIILIVVALILSAPPATPAPLGKLPGIESAVFESSPQVAAAVTDPTPDPVSHLRPEGKLDFRAGDKSVTSAGDYLASAEADKLALLPDASLEMGQNTGVTDAKQSTGNTRQHELTTRPKRIVIPALGVDATVQPVGLVVQEAEGTEYLQWSTPNEYAVGWHDSSAQLGMTGNTVLNGHNNVHGAVFGALADLPLGEQMILYDEERSYVYQITQRELFQEKGQSLKQRYWNARWMLPTSDERVTIVSCWPNTTNSHRLVVIAHRVDEVGT